jgi:hypothetical protein
MEWAISKLDEDHRIMLPTSLVRHIQWISGGEPLNAWLLVGGPGRCRLLSPTEVDDDAYCQSLRAAVNVEADQPIDAVSEFRDEASVALGLRLLPIEISPRGPGWRLTIPKTLAAIMQIHPKESAIALLFSQKHIEIWTMDTLRSSVAVPLSELI